MEMQNRRCETMAMENGRCETMEMENRRAGQLHNIIRLPLFNVSAFV